MAVSSEHDDDLLFLRDHDGGGSSTKEEDEEEESDEEEEELVIISDSSDPDVPDQDAAFDPLSDGDGDGDDQAEAALGSRFSQLSIARKGPGMPEMEQKDVDIVEMVEKLVQDGQMEKLKVDQCKAYLRMYKLRLSGKKEVLLSRIREHLEFRVKNGGEEKYPVSSFVLNCQGDSCKGDIVMFEQNIYKSSRLKGASRKTRGRLCGRRTNAGRIIKESYGTAKQQHTFTIEVLWSKGYKPWPPLRQLLIKGRNLYKDKTMRQPWADEDERKKVLQEKHARGFLARKSRDVRIQEKEMKKARGVNRTKESRSGAKVNGVTIPSPKALPQGAVLPMPQHKAMTRTDTREFTSHWNYSTQAMGPRESAFQACRMLPQHEMAPPQYGNQARCSETLPQVNGVTIPTQEALPQGAVLPMPQLKATTTTNTREFTGHWNYSMQAMGPCESAFQACRMLPQHEMAPPQYGNQVRCSEALPQVNGVTIHSQEALPQGAALSVPHHKAATTTNTREFTGRRNYSTQTTGPCETALQACRMFPQHAMAPPQYGNQVRCSEGYHYSYTGRDGCCYGYGQVLAHHQVRVPLGPRTHEFQGWHIQRDHGQYRPPEQWNQPQQQQQKWRLPQQQQCRSYREGRCQYGENCNYIHDN